MKSVYLDYNATAPIDKRVLDTMIDVYTNHVGNADSRTHDYGEDARQIVMQAREKVAELFSVRPEEVIFTSGATESSNMAIQGIIDYAVQTKKKHIITTTIEHKAVLECVKLMESKGFEVDYVSPDESGRINAVQVIELVRPDTVLVACMHVNNETGIIQPVKEIGEALSNSETLFYVDATQSCGKLVDELKSLKYDLLGFSAHKMGGPQGIGALIMKKKKYKYPPIKSLLLGGGQEYGKRAGTTPVALAAGLGKASEIASEEYVVHNEKSLQIQKRILELLTTSGIPCQIIGEDAYRMPNVLSISFSGISSEALMIATKQFCSISNGAACTSRNYSSSYVLDAMGLPEDTIESIVRVSWGSNANIEEIEYGFSALLDLAKEMK